jgi:hypothetical protein
MALSDEVLSEPDRMIRLRSRLEALARECGAGALFLVDEEGTPFATIGHVEFRLPHPLAGLVAEGEADAILAALVGEPQKEPASGLVVERLSSRALLVLVLPLRPGARLRLAIRSAARDIASLLEDLDRPTPPP